MPTGVITLIALLAVLIVNEKGSPDYTRMLIGSSIQPSELAKAVIIIYLSFWLYRRKDSLNDVQAALIPMGIILGVTATLIMLQPDLSAAVTVLILGIMLLFLAGCDWKIILIILIIALIGGLPVMFLYSTGRNRMSSYLTGLSNPLESSYHIHAQP